MTNLPISVNNTPSPAKGTPSDATLIRSDPAATSANPTSQANSAANGQAAEPFSTLLARQIVEVGEHTLNAKKIDTTTDGKAAEDAAAAAKNSQDQITVNTGITSDQASSLAAMMLQIPVADRGQSNNLHLTTGKGAIRQGIENNLLQTSDNTDLSCINKTIQADSASLATSNTKSPLLISLSSDAAQYSALTANSAAHLLTVQDNTKTAIAGTATAGTQSITASNTSANIAQTVTAPIGNSDWAGEFSQKIVWISNQNNQSAELHLNPPDLGPLNVVIKMSDNQLTVQFTSQHSAVRDAVENALPKLREILADNNIMLGNTTVSDQAPRDRSGDGYMNQGSGSSAQRESSYSATNATASNEILPIAALNVPARRHNGMLDTFA